MEAARRLAFKRLTETRELEGKLNVKGSSGFKEGNLVLKKLVTLKE
ncbi:MAG: hypothetical protein ACJAY7_000525 [Pseudohongiellaceae bacterium]|jgi:hypothetical protein